MNPDSLPSFDEWLEEAMRLADDHALWYSQTRDEPHVGRRAKLLTHLAAHPSAAPQGAQPAEPTVRFAVVQCNPSMRRLDWLGNAGWWDKLPAGNYALYASPADAAPVPQAARDVLAERKRQVDREGWTPAHDDQHNNDELAEAAACYAHPSPRYATMQCPVDWPWDVPDWKPKDRRSNLVRAGALILAEIERLDRAAMNAGLTIPATLEAKNV